MKKRHITFSGYDLEQPIITAGKIIYSDINQRRYWDLWNCWFSWDDVNDENAYEFDGTVYHFQTNDCKYIEDAYVFSLPLISITDDETLVEKIIKPFIEL